MTSKFMDLGRILRLYAKEAELLETGQFGKGLWPIDKEIGQFLQWLIQFEELQNGLEVGAGVGISSAWLGAGFAKTGGKLTCFEYFPPKIVEWEHNLAGNDHLELVPAEFTRWVKNAGRRKFDFVFFDQRKSDYLCHLKLILPKLKKGAFVCADNVLSHADACGEYLQFVRNSEGMESVCLKLGKGLEVTRVVGSWELGVGRGQFAEGRGQKEG